MNWIYLFIASLFEISWLYSLKFVEWEKIKNLIVKLDFSLAMSLIPLSGYIGFGILNVTFYSLALRTIPTSTAFAIWTGTALIGSKLIDVLFFKEHATTGQFIFLAFILVGIVGLKFASPE